MTDDERDARDERIRRVYAGTRSIRETVRKTGHTRKTVRRAIRDAGPRRAPPRRPAPGPRPSKLDPFKPRLRSLVLDDGLTAILALEELRTIGFDGSYSIVKRFVHELRPMVAKQPTGRVEHPPGEEGQVDWSPYAVLLGGEQTVVHGFSFVLPWSRYQFLRFTLDETLETLVQAHGDAFEEIRAVPQTMSYDNMTTVGRHTGPGEVWINPRFAQWAAKYDFEIKLITPGNPKEHGSVERQFHYVENNCLKRRRSRFDDLEDLNRHAAWWCAEVANVRIHGTTRRRPIDQLLIERSYLKPLPSERPEPYRTLVRKVGTDYLVAVDTNGYSVSPTLVGREVTVHLFAERVEILVDSAVHAVHARIGEKYQQSVLPEHEDEFKRITPSRRLLEGAFLRLGTVAKDYYDGLVAQRGRGAGAHLKRILRLADRYGNPAVEAAMGHAARYGNYSADAVSRVIAGRTADREPPPTTTPGDVPMPPDRVRRWLEGLDVEGSDLDRFDDLVDQHGADDDGEK